MLAVSFTHASSNVTGDAAIKLVADGKSAFCIYIAPDAPASVTTAATELQRYINKSAGCELPIISNETPPDQPMISLGWNAASRQTGMKLEDVPVEGFRIAVCNGDIYIFGHDTQENERTSMGGRSDGTLNGTYTFLEDYFDIRWLMPGEVGEDIRQHTTVQIPSIDRTEKPGFLNRRLPYTQVGLPEVKEWHARQKQGYSLRLEHAHNWMTTIPASLYKDHPEWFAMKDGTRPKPGVYYKLETTNKELVNAYAQRAIKAFDDDPGLTSYSLSPSDGMNWSDSPESLALHTTAPNGKLSRTPLILKFYNDVAEIVYKAHPDRIVCGYIYASYIYPLQDTPPAVAPNLYLIIAPTFDYGFQLYRPGTQKNLDNVLTKWGEATHNIAFYDLPTWLEISPGVITPPAPKILKFVYKRLSEQQVKGIYIYGQSAWGAGGVSNYILSKLNWDPTADPETLVQEFCNRAYGPHAGPIMRKLYEQLDDAFEKFYQAHEKAYYKVYAVTYKELYAPVYPEIEKSYLAASAQEMTDLQRARLTMFEHDLALLRWRLQDKKIIPTDISSPLYRDEFQIDRMLQKSEEQFVLNQVSNGDRRINVPSWRVTVPEQALTPTSPAQPYRLSGRSRWLLHATSTRAVTLTLNEIIGNTEARYQIYDQYGNPMAHGTLEKSNSVTLDVEKGRNYIVDIASKGGSYHLQIEGCAYAVKLYSGSGTTWIHLKTKLTPLYFHVPKDVSAFEARVVTASPGETAAGKLLDPSGKVVATFDTTDMAAYPMRIDHTNIQSGFWSIVFDKAKKGIVDDVNIVISKIPPWVIPDPEHALIVH